jgi:rare lipoprotein A (peptidoglycan hydrolase)
LLKTFVATLFVCALSIPAYAGGWATVHLYVHKTGRCAGGREVLASFYGTGARTASGERFNPHGLTAASYDYALGTSITVTNPINGRTCTVRINDHGPNGLARVMGARIDFALGARDCLGMVASQYVCAPEAQTAAAPAASRIREHKAYAQTVVRSARRLRPGKTIFVSWPSGMSMARE